MTRSERPYIIHKKPSQFLKRDKKSHFISGDPILYLGTFSILVLTYILFIPTIFVICFHVTIIHQPQIWVHDTLDNLDHHDLPTNEKDMSNASNDHREFSYKYLPL